jgi:MFS family permease
MISLDAYRAHWFGNVRADVLAGLVVALAPILEAIAFSIIAGVDPTVGQYASFSIAVLIAFAGFGAGSMLAALLLPRILRRLADRPVMIGGAALMVAGVALTPLLGSLAALMVLWALIGFGFSLTQTPIGRIINRSARPADRGAVFAAQFALSHACWLVTYPLAGWVGARFGLAPAALVLALIGAAGLVAVLRLWPASEPDALPHRHDDLPPDHPHLKDDWGEHVHPVVIDDLHRHWPARS